MSLTDTENKRWRVEMVDKTTRTVEARGFRVEHMAHSCWWCPQDAPRGSDRRIARAGSR